MLMILASRRGPPVAGIQGITQSSTITTSAFLTHGPASKPRCMAWSVGRLKSRGLGLHHRDRELIGELAELDPASGSRPMVEVTISGNSALAIIAAASSMTRRAGSGAAAPSGRMLSRRECVAGLAQDFARQRQIDRPARLAHHDVERAVDDGVDRLAVAQLVIPFHEFAHHAALVERLLAPMDGAVARGDVAGLGDRRAPGGEQQRHVVTRGVHQAADRVGGADRDVHHHRRRLAAGAVVAVRHRHRDVLVRHGDELRKLGIAGVAGNAFHDRREIGARIGEHILDAALAEPRQIGFGGHFLGRVDTAHGVVQSCWGWP